jgi:ADP-L-glycero-D-manno-heptose 6-epimerase
MLDQQHTRILVTGGAGMIGSAVVWQLNRLGADRILIADRLDRTEKWRNLAPLRFLDYLDADDLLRLLETTPERLNDIGTVYHLGACSSTTETDSAYLMRNNFDYTKSLAHWAVGNGTRFVYASSAATYGAREDDFRENLPLDSLRPLNMYGYSKHLFDQYAERAGLLDRIVGLKYFNVFGPNEDHKGEMRSVVHKAFHQIETTGQLQLFQSHRPDYEHGSQERDFLYVKDAVAMTVYLAGQREAKGLFNLGSGEPHTWLELGAAIFAALDREPQIEFIPMPETLREKYQYRTCATIGKLRAAGYNAPITPLTEAVADYVRRYLSPNLRLGDE